MRTDALEAASRSPSEAVMCAGGAYRFESASRSAETWSARVVMISLGGIHSCCRPMTCVGLRTEWHRVVPVRNFGSSGAACAQSVCRAYAAHHTTDSTNCGHAGLQEAQYHAARWLARWQTYRGPCEVQRLAKCLQGVHWPLRALRHSQGVHMSMQCMSLNLRASVCRASVKDGATRVGFRPTQAAQCCKAVTCCAI